MSSPQTVHSVSKAFSILELIAGTPETLTIKEVIHTLDLPPASCYRLIRTLLEGAYLSQDASGGLGIGYGIANLARRFSETEREIQSLLPVLRGLAARLHLAAKISLREGDWAVTRLRAEPAVSNTISNPVGTRVHLAQGSAATVLLSELEDAEVKAILDKAPEKVWHRQKPEEVLCKVREFRCLGVARDFGVQHPSIYAMSMGARLRSGAWIAVSVVGWPENFQGGKELTILEALRETMERIQGHA